MRLGVVSYLNTRPLVYRFLREPAPEFELVHEVPSALAARLRSRDLGAAIISSIECFRGGGFEMLPGAGIVSHGAVLSIMLYCRVPPDRVRSVALDANSRSAAALTRILFREYWQADPEFVSLPPDLESMLRTCDAALLIGDPALRQGVGAWKVGGGPSTRGGRVASRKVAEAEEEDAASREGPLVFDLGAVWTEMSGLPFVFAVWAGWPGAFDHERGVLLLAAKEYGKAHLPEIAVQESRALSLPLELCQAYLGGAIQYDVGERELEGLRCFVELAQRHGLLKEA